MTKKVLAIFVLAGGMASGSASAQTSCDDVDTLLGWSLASAGGVSGACLQEDKLWAFDLLGTTLDPGTPIDFSLISLAGIDFHTLTVSFVPNLPADDVPYTLHYSIAITDPTKFFLGAQVDSTNPAAADSSVLKSFNGGADGTIESVDGIPDFIAFGAGINFLDVSELITVGPLANLTNITNTFTQAAVAVPEPGSLALLGLGLAGLGFARRRQ